MGVLSQGMLCLERYERKYCEDNDRVSEDYDRERYDEKWTMTENVMRIMLVTVRIMTGVCEDNDKESARIMAMCMWE